MALDIARGLSYLADLKFVHRLVFSRPILFLSRYSNYHNISIVTYLNLNKCVGIFQFLFLFSVTVYFVFSFL